MVRFAHNDPGLLACCSLDGSLSICQVTEGEPRVLHRLRGHSAGVTGESYPIFMLTTITIQFSIQPPVLINMLYYFYLFSVLSHRLVHIYSSDGFFYCRV